MGGGKADSGGEAHDYFGSIAGAVACGPVDWIGGVFIDNKLVWPKCDEWTAGTYATNTLKRHKGRVWKATSSTASEPGTAGAAWTKFKVILSTNPYKFTVEDYGECFFYRGTSNQTLDTVDEKILSDNGHHPYRYRAVLVLKDFLWGRERTSAPNVQVLCGRKPTQTIITGSAANLDADDQCNPMAFLAEVLTHPIIGAEIPDSELDAASWQAEADRQLAISSRTYISPMIDREQALPEIIDRVQRSCDIWLYRNAAGLITVGHWPHAEAPPVFTSANTIDIHDLAGDFEMPWDSDLFEDTYNRVTVKYLDALAAFKEKPASAPNALNRKIVGRTSELKVEANWITRGTQAIALAQELAYVEGQPKFASQLALRAEKVTAITPGQLFLLTNDDLGISRVCRCLERTIPKPPSGRITIRYELERGISGTGYAPTILSPSGSPTPKPDRITNFQFVQVPPVLAGGVEFQVACLAARANPVTAKLEVWFKKDETGTSFYPLGSLTSFAVAATVAESVNTLDISGEILTSSSVLGDSYNLDHNDVWQFKLYDDGVEATLGIDYLIDSVQGTITILESGTIADGSVISADYCYNVKLTVAAGTPQPDLDRIMATQTLDAIGDDSLLLFVFKNGSPAQFEIMTVKEVNAIGSGQYTVNVRRPRFGTLEGGDGSYVFTSSDRAFFVFRTNINVLVHERFTSLAIAGLAATFRLTPGSAWFTAEVADKYDISTNPSGLTTEANFTFSDPYKPIITWEALLEDGVDITDLTAEFDITTKFTFTWSITDANVDLVETKLIARFGSVEQTLSTHSLPLTGGDVRTATFTLPEGDWVILAVATDASGRIVEQPLMDLGGITPRTLKMRATGGNTVANPIANPPGGSYSYFAAAITLTCSTPGATIEYQITNIYSAPGGSWGTYTAPFKGVTAGRSLHFRAKKAGMIDSPVVTSHYAYSRNGPHRI